MPSRKRGAPKRRGGRQPKPTGVRRAGGFVGRDGSPVLDRYPPKDPALAPRGPPKVSPPSPATAPRPPAPVPAAAASPSEPGTPKPIGLIALEKPFDVDDFSQLLGETSIRVLVPREDLAEVLRRISEFMGFGIYVYAIRIHPAPSDLLKQFVLELTRVDYSAEKRDWLPFQERGVSDSPFGPTGQR